ncbi:Hsp70 family protein [Cryptosporangium minutisporangium]|uniref:Hsp70 family protein n=1 Tax=Cryptosporangium minutisporangium TaxID=113569 RepID=UPI0031EBCC1B
MHGTFEPSLAIDFGSTHTVAALRGRDGRVQPLMFDGSFLLPSAVLIAPDGRMVVGRDAERGARLEPSRFEPNPKRRVDDGAVLLGDRNVPVPHLVAAVLRRVADEAARVAGSLPADVVLSHPAGWGAHRRQVLVDAAARAGLPAVRFVPEPVAAARYFTGVLGRSVPDGSALLVYDFGGGTFDTSVLQAADGGWRVLATDGLPDVGGLDLDAAIVEHLRVTLGVWSPDQWARLVHATDDAARRRNRMLWEDVRAAKEQLSRSSSASLLVPVLDVDVHLTRDEFERLARPYLERTADVAAGALQRAGIRADQLAGVFLVGGSSRIPLVGTLLHHRIGVAPTVIEQPELVVALGSSHLPERAPEPRSAPPPPGPTFPGPPPFGSPVAAPSPTGIPLGTPPTGSSAGTHVGRRRGVAAIAGVLVVVLVAVVLGWTTWPWGGSDEKTGVGQADSASSPPVAATGSARPGAPHQEVTVNKTAWYGPLKITFGKMVYDAGMDDQLTVETTVENEGPKNYSPRIDMTFTLDGVQSSVSVSDVGAVAGKQKTRLVYSVRSLEVKGSVADGFFTIGSGDEAQAVVPAGNKGKLVAYQPRSVLPKPVTLTLRDLVVTVQSCHVRGGFFDFNGQADAGYEALNCILDVQYTRDTAGGHIFDRDTIVLVQPNGTEVGSTPLVSEALYGPEIHRNVMPGYLVKSPAKGQYRLRLVDVHAGETRSDASVKDLPLTL